MGRGGCPDSFPLLQRFPVKRIRADSSDSAVKAMVDAAAGPLPPPDFVLMRACDAPFWAAIVCARARDEWAPADLVVAAQLARCQADIERESTLLYSEGSVLTNEHGTLVCNARVSVMEQLARREMALMRSLRMGGRASGDASKDATRRKIQRQAEGAREELADEELLAT